MKNFNEMTMPWADRPNALFVAFAPVDNPRYAAAVVVEHGNWGGMASAPIARDLLTYAITNDLGGRDVPLTPQAASRRGATGMNADSIALHRPFRDRSFGLVRKFLRVNWLFVLCVCLLAGVGYAALYSAAGGSGSPYANSQMYRFVSALLLMLAIAMVDIRAIAKISWVTYGFGVLLLLVVMKFGHTGLGAKRWMTVGGMEIQPSELMKLFLVLALASYFHKASYERIGNLLFLLPAVVVVLLPVGLILKEPNLGTAVITALIGCSVMLAAGVQVVEIRHHPCRDRGGSTGAVPSSA